MQIACTNSVAPKRLNASHKTQTLDTGAAWPRLRKTEMKNLREMVDALVAEFDGAILRANHLVDTVVAKLADKTMVIDLPPIKLGVKDMDDLFYSMEQKMEVFASQRGLTIDSKLALNKARAEFRRIQSAMAAWRYKVHSHELMPTQKPTHSLDEIQAKLQDIMDGKKPKRVKAKPKSKKAAMPKLSKYETAKFLIALGEMMKKHRLALYTAITNQMSEIAYGDFVERLRGFGISETRIPQVYKLGCLLFDMGEEGW